MDVNRISITNNHTIRHALEILERTGEGILVLLNDQGLFSRTVTDGDLRRLLLNGYTFDDPVKHLAARNSIVIPKGYTRAEALLMINQHEINHLPVLDERGRVIEIIARKEIDQQILLSSPHMGEEEMCFVEEAFKSNWIAPLGPNVDAFERELAAHVRIQHAAALSSGTAAIHLGLKLLDVGKGDLVFCSALTFIASAGPITYLNAEPVFIDSDYSTWNMCPQALEAAFLKYKQKGRLPKAVLVVHLYGQSADMDPILEICNRFGVPILEDAAESLGGKYKNRHSGTFGSMGVYSFNGNKIITTSGGGMLVSENADLIQRARFLSTQARDPAPHYEHTEIGFNYRMSNILAGVGRGQLKVLDKRVEARRAIFERYRAELAGLPMLEWMPQPDWSYSNCWLSAATLAADFALSTVDLIDRMKQELIECRHLWKPMNMQPVFSGCDFVGVHKTPVANDLFERGVCLPSGSNMTEDQQGRVIESLRRVLTTV